MLKMSGVDPSETGAMKATGSAGVKPAGSETAKSGAGRMAVGVWSASGAVVVAAAVLVVG